MRRNSEWTGANPEAKGSVAAQQQRLRGLVQKALVDAYDESEQRTGFFTMIEEHLALPFETKVPSVAITVEQIELTEAGEIVANCRRRLERQSIPILALPLPKPPPAGAEWIEAYRAGDRKMTRSIPHQIAGFDGAALPRNHSPTKVGKNYFSGFFRHASRRGREKNREIERDEGLVR